MSKALSRRAALRGTFGGAAVAVGLPFLDCFLDSSGTALAATGAPLPVCFGTWFQHLGLNPGMWVPKTIGAKYENNTQLKVLDPFRDRMNIFSGMKYFMDGRPLETHVSGMQIATTGGLPTGTNGGPSVDAKIAGTVGARTRFRSIEVSLAGSRQSASQRSGTAPNPSEASPLALYTRIFGPGFSDPNAAEFTPDPMTLARRSALSYVTDQRQAVVRSLGAADRARLDEYFTALREIEQQLELDLQKPEPLAACVAARQPEEVKPSTVVEDASKNAKLFGTLLAHAIACGQTRVFNVMVGALGMRKRGSAYNWHMATHEESVDEKLGYQREVFSFVTWGNETFAEFLRTLDSVKEGPGSVLDRTVVLWQTDHSDARTHSLENLPVLTVGGAGGRLKTGLHIYAPGDPVTRVGLTLQQVFGVPINSWGQRSNETTRAVTDIIGARAGAPA